MGIHGRKQTLFCADRPAAAEVGNAAQDSIGGMRVLVDNAALAAALPLAPQASASVPILLHTAQAGRIRRCMRKAYSSSSVHVHFRLESTVVGLIAHVSQSEFVGAVHE